MKFVNILIVVVMLAPLYTVRASERPNFWSTGLSDACKAAQANDVAALTKIVEQDPGSLVLQEECSAGYTPLLHAIVASRYNESSEAIDYILSTPQGKKSVHLKNFAQESPLRIAVMMTNSHAVRSLLEAKANPDEEELERVGLFNLAVNGGDRKKRAEMVSSLVFHGMPIIEDSKTLSVNGVILNAYIARKKLQEEQAQVILDAERSNNQSLFAAKEALDQENGRLREQLQNAAAQGEADRKQYQEIMRAAEREAFRKQLALAVKLAQLQHEKRLAAQEGKEREEWEMVDAAM